MVRLTVEGWRDLTAADCCYLATGCFVDSAPCPKCRVPRLYARLGAYEDSGLEPGEIDGRVKKPVRVKVRRRRRA